MHTASATATLSSCSNVQATRSNALAPDVQRPVMAACVCRRDSHVHGLVDLAIGGLAKDLWPLLDLLCRIAERSPAAMQQVRHEGFAETVRSLWHCPFCRC